MKPITLALFFTAACGASPMPGADTSDGAGAMASALHQIARPCGFTLAYDTRDFDGTTSHTDWNATITYDAAGNDIAEQAIDPTSGAIVMRDATTYDAAGRWLVYTWDQSDTPHGEYDATYDGGGNLVRYAGKDDGTGQVTWTATYTYDGDRRATAHLVFPTETYDRAYRYGADGRLAELDKDLGPDGVVDFATSYAYDDGARRESRTVHDASGQVVGTGTTQYDERDRVTSIDDQATAAAYTSDIYQQHAFDGDREATWTFGNTDTRTADGAVQSTKNVITWTYCPSI